MSFLIGIIGKPNAGKSTFFSALTSIDAKIASFPFTTIEPNKGVAYVRKPCPHKELGKECRPKDSFCKNGTRFIPIQLLDVAGLVPEAHKGKGLGHKFLDDLSTADGFIHIVDGSGSTDLEGNPGKSSPEEEVEFLLTELDMWIYSIIERNWKKIKGRDLEEVYGITSSLKIAPEKVNEIIRKTELSEKRIEWSEEERLRFATELRKAKPMLVAVNKSDRKPQEWKLDVPFIEVSALYELSLRKAAENGIIEYLPGDERIEIKGGNEEQKKALERIVEFIKKNKGTGAQKILEKMVFGMLGQMAVYPVEDENKWSDKKGNVLPNVFLMDKRSTPLDVAERIHTDFAKNFIGAVDGRTKRKIGKETKLKDGDIVKILANA
ncbi:redox-regulated ATPase YchF [Candidatus Micrarchaeota archaeon]|nr:redox-regulated ATPase YchF [Candidatus Micrarchaeota archaeon]